MMLVETDIGLKSHQCLSVKRKKAHSKLNIWMLPCEAVQELQTSWLLTIM